MDTASVLFFFAVVLVLFSTLRRLGSHSRVATPTFRSQRRAGRWWEGATWGSLFYLVGSWALAVAGVVQAWTWHTSIAATAPITALVLVQAALHAPALLAWVCVTLVVEALYARARLQGHKAVPLHMAAPALVGSTLRAVWLQVTARLTHAEVDWAGHHAAAHQAMSAVAGRHAAVREAQDLDQRVETLAAQLLAALAQAGGHVTEQYTRQVVARDGSGGTHQVPYSVQVCRVAGSWSYEGEASGGVRPVRARFGLEFSSGVAPQVINVWRSLAAEHGWYVCSVPRDAAEYDPQSESLLVWLVRPEAPEVELPPRDLAEEIPALAPPAWEDLSPLSLEGPPLSVLNEPNRHAIGRTNEGRTASQAALAAIRKMGMADAEIREVKSGPVVSTSIIHLPSAKASDINSIEANLRFFTGQKNLRAYQAEGYPSSIAVEWPNASRATVGLREVCAAPEIRNSRGDLVGVLGVTTTGQPIPTDVAAWPNGLIGGQPGAGKSGFENALLVSLLLRYSPAELRLLPIDPKKVELRPYRALPHLLCPPIIQPSLAGPAFSWAVAEMERRYDLMERMGVKKLSDLNKRLYPDQRLPRILILVDEAQMVMEDKTSGELIQDAGTALATMSRASGVHLLFATQKPVISIVPTVIKACLTTRVGFATATAKESEVILDQGGTEALLGKGDLLARIGEGSTLIRAQSPWVDDAEVAAVVAWWVEHAEQVFDPGLMAALGIGSGMATGPVATDRGSISTSARPRLVVVHDDEEDEGETAATAEDYGSDDIRGLVDDILGNGDDPGGGDDDNG